MASKFLLQREIRHNGLNKYRIVKAETHYELENKCDAQLAQWEAQWQRKLEQDAKAKERERRNQNAEKASRYAATQTKEAEAIQEALDNILINSIYPQAFDFNTLRDFSQYPISKPRKPQALPLPIEPSRTDDKYNPKPSLLTQLSKKKMQEFNQSNDYVFQLDHAAWEKRIDYYTNKNRELEADYQKKVHNWELEKSDYYQAQEAKNKTIDDFQNAFQEKESSAVERYFSLFLESIEYPFSFDHTVAVEYSKEDKRLIVDMFLPVAGDIPTLKSVTYIKSKNEFKNNYYPQSYLKQKYDAVIYQIVLQILNYIFSTTDNSLVQAVAVNGKINTIDKATGKHIEPYVLSISLQREDFTSINLETVDPKTWFKSAKGVSAVTFANVTPIAPIIQMRRYDPRFVEGYSVVDRIDEGVNLAAMDWQDFENLIRDIFEQEFNVNGGEVKVTQASRDGGVDAIAYDPDPIRGGKIVIQAKRYTNVVGVSAVRDLYGTVLNEGATKGILVTTSNFGNDAYHFARGKPLTLMNGANLLFLLEKHGHKAKIDIKEARNMLGLSN